MKISMQEMTIDDLNGHWKTKDGAVHIWIDKDKQCVQLFENRQLILDEPLNYQYVQPNMWKVSETVTLFMICPQDNSIILKIGEAKIEFWK